jgi:hypothetical protein
VNVVLLRQTQISPGERYQRHSGSRKIPQCRTPVLKRPEHPRPVVELTVIHDVPLLSSLCLCAALTIGRSVILTRKSYPQKNKRLGVLRRFTSARPRWQRPIAV